VAILGYTVSRQADDGPWITLETVNYGTPGYGDNGVHTYNDLDPRLTEGVTYRYQIKAFSDATHSITAATAEALPVLPAFTASLATPAKGSVVDLNSENLVLAAQLSAGNPLEDSDAQYLYFAPLVRERTGSIVFYQELRVNLVDEQIDYWSSGEGWVGLDDLDGTFGLAGYDPDNRTVWINLSQFAGDGLWQPGITYEWDFFGAWNGGDLGSSSDMTSMNATYENDDGLAISYADSYQAGQDTLNGWYTFTVTQGGSE